MNIAIIDCGTNTFNLLIQDTLKNEQIHNSKVAVRLAQGSGDENHISENAMKRAIDALNQHVETIKSFEVDETFALATAAIRESVNGKVLVTKAEQECGVKINVIDGQKEADLIYEGVKRAISFKEDTPTLIMDVGGGSTEFILIKNNEIRYKNSFKIGCGLMLEHFRPNDPILPEQIEEIEEFLTDKLAELFEVANKERPKVLVGCSGSFDTLAQMCAVNFKTSRIEEDDINYTFDQFEYMQIAKQMITSNFEDRLNTPGMIPIRADMIVMACIQINFILKRLGIKMIQQCNYALKEGVFFTLSQNKNQWQVSSL